MKTLALGAFNELEREEKSLYVRAIFEHAASCACKYNTQEFTTCCEYIFDGDKEKQTCALVYNPSSKTFLFLGDETTLSILSLYNETRFMPKDRFELDDNVFAIPVSPDTIFRYTTSDAAKKIPGMESILEGNTWRKKPEALVYEKGEPLLVVRSLGYYNINRSLVTPSYFACDANAAITEQLVNVKSFNKNTHLTFPAGEGRGAVFFILWCTLSSL